MRREREPLYFIPIETWVFLLAAAALWIAFAVWVCFGTIRTTAECRGVVVGSGNTGKAIVAAVDGNILKHLMRCQTRAVVYSVIRSEERSTLAGTVVRVRKTPLLRKEIAKLLGSEAAAAYICGDSKETQSHYVISVAIDTGQSVADRSESDSSDADLSETGWSEIDPSAGGLLPYEECTVTLILKEEKPYRRFFFGDVDK